MHDRKRIRLAGFNYSADRYYFITICTKGNIYPFGIIENKTMILSPKGYIAIEQWKWLGYQYPYVDLISFVVMPDHVHGIIHINTDYYNKRIFGKGWVIRHDQNNIAGNVRDNIVGNDRDNIVGNGRDNIVGNGRDHSLQSMQTNPKIKPLPELIGAYKTTVSKRIHMFGDVEFKWQKSYYDYIIRNIKSLNIIKHYIEQNPENWMK